MKNSIRWWYKGHEICFGVIEDFSTAENRRMEFRKRTCNGTLPVDAITIGDRVFVVRSQETILFYPQFKKPLINPTEFELYNDGSVEVELYIPAERRIMKGIEFLEYLQAKKDLKGLLRERL